MDDLHTHNTFNSSPNNQFGSFILLASSNSLLPDTSSFQISMEYSLIRISSSSESIDSVSRSSSSSGGGGGCLWSAPGFTCSDDNHNQDDNDDQLFKVDNNSGGGLVFKLDNIGFPEYDKSYVFSKRLIGSSNGLICLHDTVLQEVYLWNPNTKEYKTLPKALQVVENRDRFPMDLVAFGFDVETKDYKVMLLTGFETKNHRPAAPPTEFLCRVQVYSLSTDSWRVLEDLISLPGFPFYYFPTDFPTELVCLNNGSCFFLAHYFRNKHQLCFAENNRLVISFDFTKEIFTPIELPEHNRHEKLYLSSLGDDKIALFIVSCKPSPRGDNYYPDSYLLPPPSADPLEIYEPPGGIYYSEVCGCQDFNIWVLDQHVISNCSSSSGVNKESWRQFSSFQIKHQTPGQWSSPNCISNDGKFALLETINPWPMESNFGKKMKLYNLVTKEVKKDFLSCSRVMSKAYAYKPSPVSIIGGKGGGVEKEEEQQQPPIMPPTYEPLFAMSDYYYY